LWIIETGKGGGERVSSLWPNLGEIIKKNGERPEELTLEKRTRLYKNGEGRRILSKNGGGNLNSYDGQSNPA